jgi:hypothetical protein
MRDKQMSDHQNSRDEHVPMTGECEDGFAGYAEGLDSLRIIQGDLLKFSNDGIWSDRSTNAVFPPNRELAVADLQRVSQKWINKERVETRLIAPGQPMPDIDELNAACPKSEWGPDLNNNLRGPWQNQTLLYLIDLSSMEKFTFPTGTIGGSIAVGEIVEKTKTMRRFRGINVYPVVLLRSKSMKTKFGTRPRPHFEVQRWITLGGIGGGGQALPAPTTETGPILPASVTSQVASDAGGSGGVVEEPSLNEEMNDDIPFITVALTPRPV